MTRVLFVSSLNGPVSREIQQVASVSPERIGVLSRAQVADLDLPEGMFELSQGIELTGYPFHEKPASRDLLFLGRISREKQIEFSLRLAQQTGRRLLVGGYLQDVAYFDELQATYPETLEYLGFLEQAEMCEAMGQAEALILTPTWKEAFGQVVIEALACGLPVLTFADGGPGEIIKHGKTGYLIARNDPESALSYVEQIPLISRQACREEVVRRYSLEALCDRYTQWFTLVQQGKTRQPVSLALPHRHVTRRTGGFGSLSWSWT